MKSIQNIENIQMENIQNYLNFCNNKIIGIIGLARSGIAVLYFLEKLIAYGCNLKVYVYDDSIQKQQEYSNYFIDIENKLWHNCNLIIMSPGIAKTHKIFNMLENIKKISDIEFYYQLNLHNKNNDYYIGITGTNGKSTITSQLAYCLNIEPYGNIGNSIFNKILQSNSLFKNDKNIISNKESQSNSLFKNDQNSLSKEILQYNNSSNDDSSFSNNDDSSFSSKVLQVNNFDITLIEISSFQLDLQDIFKSNIAIITNITEDHLDRYDNMQEYIESKLKILQNSTEKDFAIINLDDDILFDLFLNKRFNQFSCKIIFISLKNYIFNNKGSILYEALNINALELQALSSKIEYALNYYINLITKELKLSKNTNELELSKNTNTITNNQISNNNDNSKQIINYDQMSNNNDNSKRNMITDQKLDVIDIKLIKNYIQNNNNYKLLNKIFTIITMQIINLKNNDNFKYQINSKYQIEQSLIKLSQYQELNFCNQIVKKINFNNYEITIVNDSKGTNPASTAACMLNYENIYLIAGGIFKSYNLTPLDQHKNKIIKIFLYGRDKYLIKEKLENKFESIICENLDQAYSEAIKLCKADCLLSLNNTTNNQKTILFSPMSASLDSFQSFYHRGLYFNSLIDKILI
ncbi:MAG: Mur ligase family protein [Rickettsiales bacterium]